MNETIMYTIIATLTGVVGTGLGGVISIFIKTKSNKFLSCMLEFSGGLMVSIVFLELLPSALEKSNIINVILGIAIGIFFMYMTQMISFKNSNSLIQVGLVMAIGIAMHNIPEGLAIGVSLEVDLALGMSLIIAILVHNVPEGIAFAMPLRMGGMKKVKIVVISIITGLATGVGGLIGVILGEISNNVVSLSLAIASGAMLFVVFYEIIPKSKEIYKGTLSSFFNLIGITFGILLRYVIR